MHKKEGQISAFVLLGIVLLLATALVIYFRAAQIEQLKLEIEEELEAAFVAPPLENYVQNCLIQEGKKSVLKLASHGGTLSPRDNIFYNNNRINYLCYNEGTGNACIPSLLVRQDMESELALDINNKIKTCVELSYFERDYKVTAGMPRTTVVVGTDNVVASLNYPINMTREDEKISVTEFKAVISYPLGKAYELAVDIVNEEITNDFFDKDKWMKETAREFLIEKHRPYPDIIYIISKEEFVFQFGLQGFSTVAQYRFKPLMSFDACFNAYDNKCFMNVPAGKCQQKGLAQIQEKCPKTLFETKELCEGRECKNCVLPDGQTKTHGESWCVYDTITGNGYDYVGSRHFLHTCIDGMEIIEECRDYREELCTQGWVEEKTKAVCRPNRWQSCSACTTELCCENSELRDCVWSEWLDVEQKCHPAVPPGLRHWLREGSDVCFAANDKKECSGLSCPNRYVDTAAISCYYQADCGNYRNIADDITFGGFFESDIFDSVRDYVYLPDGYNQNPTEKGKAWVLNLPLDKREQKRIKGEYETPIGNIPVIISAVYNFVDEVDKTSITDLVNPFREKPVLHILDVNYCDLWIPPLGNKCNLCSADPKKPCSEYRCMSLGQNCIFESVNGTGICRYEYFDDNKPPQILIDREVITEGYEYKEASLGDYKGFEILPDIEPHDALTLGITTSEQTRCKLNYGPRTKYYNLPSFYFGTGAFEEKHNITFRSPPRLSIPPKVMDILNFSRSSDFLGFIDKTFEMYDYYKKRLSFEIKMYKSMTGKDPLIFIDPLVQRAREYFNRLEAQIKVTTRALFEQFDQGGYYMFVNCIDRGG
ncbi:hypothetical protein KY339_00425, partial [Candidatus Woesearchaeota archaeon]|nr:hypothetical protein [Candidatus Woesearchaeota archaeon]